MKTLLSLCVVMTIAALAYGQMPDFGGMIKQASGMASMIPGMSGGGGDNPFSAMMKQFEEMVGQAGAPDKMMSMMKEYMTKAPETAQKTMGEFMQKMSALKEQGAPQEKMMALLMEMKKASGQ